MNVKIKQPYSKQSRAVFFASCAVYALLFAYQLITEARMPSLATEWVFYLSIAMFAVATAYFSYTNLSSFVFDQSGVTHRSFFGKAIRRIAWQDLKTAEVATLPSMPFTIVYILVSDRYRTPSQLRSWMRQSSASDTSAVFAIPYSDEAVESINRFSPINCGSIVRADRLPKAYRAQ
jgi:hypothetical protein